MQDLFYSKIFVIISLKIAFTYLKLNIFRQKPYIYIVVLL